MNLAYNSRGLMTQYSLTGVKEDNGAARAEGSDFQYYANGQVKFASDLYERQFSSMSAHDKSYQYDHAGRLQIALSGVQANDVVNGTNSRPYVSAPPYLQTYTHDTWSNLVSRTGTYWSEDDIIEPQTYDAHNRNLAWAYDADGRLLSMNEQPFNELPYVAPAHIYDASGRHTQVSQTTSKPSPSNPNLTFTTVTTDSAIYDGDGQQVKQILTRQTNGGQPGIETTCYLRSSVLGQVITEYNAQGVRQKSFVYAGGALIASTNLSGLQWRYNNPVTGDGLETDTQGKVYAVARLDPEGVDAGATDPADNHGEAPPPDPLPHAGAYAAFLPHSLGGSGRCSANWMDTGCGFVIGLLAAGAANLCGTDDCSLRSVTVNITYKDGTRRSMTGLSDIPDGNYVWTGDDARAAARGWNFAWVLTEDFDTLVKASMGAAWLSEQGYGRLDSQSNFAGPQDSRPIVGFDHIWDDLADIIKDGTCRSFIADLIGTAQALTDKKAHAFTVEGLLAELKAHPKNHPMGGIDGIGLLPTGADGGAGGWDTETGLGFANIDNFHYTGSRRVAERDLALRLLHEIIHTSTKGRTSPYEAYGGYNDVELAQAVFEITKDPKDNIENITPGTKFGPTARGGIIWDRALRKYCK